MIRIGLSMLLGDRGRFIAILMGIGFSAFLMTLQGSIFAGIMTRTVALLRDTGGADVWVMDPKVQYIDDAKPMSETALWRVRSVPGVAWAVPYTRNLLKARLADGTFQTCMVLGLDDASLTGGPPEMVSGRLDDLRRTDGVIVDVVGASTKLAHVLPDGTRVPLAIGDTLELNDRRAVVVGLCRVSRSFQSLPSVYTVQSRAAGYAPAERKRLSFILVGAKAGGDPEALAADIRAATGLGALSLDGFKRLTVIYYMRNTPIPINIGIGVIMALIVGTVISGLTFSGFVAENQRYLGALKAMGATNGQLAMMTLAQAGLVGFIGYGLGMGGSAVMGHLLRNTELAFRLPQILPVAVAVLVMFMCGLSALFSLRRVIRLEPAIVFRS